MDWLLNILGVTNSSGRWYAFWDVFADLPLAGILIGVWHHHNCHVQGCWRIGIRTVEGTPHIVCRKHHPAEKGPHVSAADIRRDAALAARTGAP